MYVSMTKGNARWVGSSAHIHFKGGQLDKYKHRSAYGYWRKASNTQLDNKTFSDVHAYLVQIENETEVAQLTVVLRGDKYVLWFDVHVHQVVVMEMFDSLSIKSTIPYI